MIAEARVLILPEWDIVDELILDAVRKETKPLEGVTYRNDHVALVMWSLGIKENKRRDDTSESSYLGGMIVERVKDTRLVEATSTTLESTKFNMVVVEKQAKEKIDLQVKLEVILKAYNEAKLEVASKDITIAKLKSHIGGQQKKGESSNLMIASSPTRPPPTSPFIEFPLSLVTPRFQSTESIQDEMEKLKQAQDIFANKYEEKIKGTILKFADTIGASIVYINMKRVLSMLTILNEDKAILEPILNKWMAREVDL